ncbi:MAG TPA: M15 family metallopeptidase [Candidatus Limnocylindria bacterium]|jgi:D-alanyl-D-alanine carboxypeptidase|nr:M15 family metallopeptidase [Candidatus Limnocylindria bacterium]
MALTTLTRLTAAVLAAASLTGCVAAAAAPSPAATATAAPSATPSVTQTPVASASLPAAPTVEPSPDPTARPAAPSPEPVPTPEPTPANPSYCRVADVLTPNTSFDDHVRTYLDWTYRLPADYVPPDLVSATSGKPADDARLLIRALAYEDLARLRAAALAAGQRLVVVSAYRSYEQQAQTFDYWSRVGGYDQALRTSARPGHSEHQLGTAIDFGDGTAAPWEYADWAKTPTGSWLASHAADFGFVMSYPKGQTGVTCYGYEPWHYRYVGIELAKTLVASGLSLREFQSVSASLG